MDADLKMMRKALSFAKKALGRTSPNPMVGALLVHDGSIVGSGWHHICGGPHAEVNAFNSVADKSLISDSTLYVTLEPCSTVGRTGSCCDLILRTPVKRVVIGSLDPNPKHSGRGVDILRSAGIDVTVGVCENECRELNAPFMKWIVEKRPYVLLKMAETLDGKIATHAGESKWITGPKARERVMALRMMSDAILAGAETWRLDNPRFTVRDTRGNVLKRPKLFAATHAEKIPERDDVVCVSLDSPADWEHFLASLGESGILMLLIEGGGELSASALRAGVVDEVEFHIAPKLLGGRNSRTSMGGDDTFPLANAIDLESVRVRMLGDDLQVRGRPLCRSSK